MTLVTFRSEDLEGLWQPGDRDNKFGAGQVVIVGGSSLFHGAPILALKSASRLVCMVYFASPEEDKSIVNNIKSGLGSFIWIPSREIDHYILKSDAVLIGPGMMRNQNEADGMACDDKGKISQEISMSIFNKFPEKKYVIDGGSLQVIHASDIPKGSIITPNRKEFEMLFKEQIVEDADESIEQLRSKAKEYQLTIVHKAPTSIVTNGDRVIKIEGGNPGLVKGGMGDVIAGLTVGLLAKNEPMLAAAAAIYLTKRAADRLLEKVGNMYNADDLAEETAKVFGEEVK